MVAPDRRPWSRILSSMSVTLRMNVTSYPSWRQPPPQDVEVDRRPHVPDVWLRLNRQPTDVDPRSPGLQGDEVAHFARRSVVEPESHPPSLGSRWARCFILGAALDVSSRYVGKPTLPIVCRPREVQVRRHTLMKLQHQGGPRTWRRGWSASRSHHRVRRRARRWSAVARSCRSPAPAPGGLPASDLDGRAPIAPRCPRSGTSPSSAAIHGPAVERNVDRRDAGVLGPRGAAEAHGPGFDGRHRTRVRRCASPS